MRTKIKEIKVYNRNRNDIEFLCLGEAFENEFLCGKISSFFLNDDNSVSVYVKTDLGQTELAIWFPPHVMEAVYFGEE